MGNKNKAKRKGTKTVNLRTQKDPQNGCNREIENLNNYFVEDLKGLCKELPFASISNKELRTIGFKQMKKASRDITVIPLKFPSKLFPVLKNIFAVPKANERELRDHLASFEGQEDRFVTIISFQRFIQNGNQMKPTSVSLPNLQVMQIPRSSNIGDNKFSLYLTETDIKQEKISHVEKVDHPNAENIKYETTKTQKKRSFFNDIWRKKSVSINKESPTINDPVLEDLDTRSPTSPNNTNLSLCMFCKKEAFIAEKIEIGPDVFHNSCFKCCHCSKGLYRGKWNKHQEQYYCDYCYKRIMWPFVRR